MTTTAEPLADQGPCDWCTHPQWSHKRGKGGCNDVQCGGACDRYTPPKDRPAPPAEPEPVAEPEPAIDEQPAQPEPTCAYPDGEDQGEHDHAMCEDVVAERAEDAEVERLAADRARLRARLAGRVRQLDEALTRIAVLERENRVLVAERNEARGEAANLQRLLAEQEQHAARERGARSAEIAQLQEELARATTARQRLQDQRDQAVHTGLNAASQVIGRYTAYACLTCGARYGKPYTDHACGDLVPVVVTIARADRPGSEPSKEQ